jgi:hypothetical protein
MTINTLKKTLLALSIAFTSTSTFSALPAQFTCKLQAPGVTYAVVNAVRQDGSYYSDSTGLVTGDAYKRIRVLFNEPWFGTTNNSYPGVDAETDLFSPDGSPSIVYIQLWHPRGARSSGELVNQMLDIVNPQFAIIPFSQLASGYTANVRVPVFTNLRAKRWKAVDATVKCAF